MYFFWWKYQNCWNMRSTWCWEGTTTWTVDSKVVPSRSMGLTMSVSVLCATPIYLWRPSKQFILLQDQRHQAVLSFFAWMLVSRNQACFCIASEKTTNHYKYPLLNKNGWTFPHESESLTLGKGLSSPTRQKWQLFGRSYKTAETESQAEIHGPF